MDENINNNKPKQGPGSGKGSNMKALPGEKGKTNNPAGRPKGTTNKVSIRTLIKSVQQATGMSFEDRLSLNYQNAINAEDRAIILAYDRLLVSKLIADAKPEDDKPEDKPLPWQGD
jgi:hypothetical protein